MGNYKNLQKALLHKSDRVAYLALNLLRKIKGLAIETKIGGIKLVAARGGAGKTRTIVGLIMNSLKNPKEPKFTQEIRNKEIEK